MHTAKIEDRKKVEANRRSGNCHETNGEELILGSEKHSGDKT